MATPILVEKPFKSEQGSVRSNTRSTAVVPSKRDDPYQMGKSLRDKCPRKSHGRWKAPGNRPDAVELVMQAERGRMPELLPLRRGRMVRSAFTFYRGAAVTMACDLATTPTTGIRVQCCGDAHLCNFGGFATPERKVIFSVNDLDETLPAPWEWDVKRLAASFLIASRENGLSDRIGKDVVASCVRTYRESMAEFSEMKTLELWYQSIVVDDLVADIKDSDLRQRALKRLLKEKGHGLGDDIFPRLVDSNRDIPVIKDQPPTIFHAEGHLPGEIEKVVLDSFAGYRETLSHSGQVLLDRYQLRDAAIKVVGVGSVGTRCWIMLFTAGTGDPLFLQFKEARRSVLEDYAGASVFPNSGQRIVNGHRLMQPASDMFLGWTEGALEGHHYFIRQLRDIKISIRVEAFGAREMNLYATWCGRALALAHARTGCSKTVSGYMGKSDTFDQALAEFSVAYADQNERDHAALKKAIRGGKVKTVFEESQ